jgi:hypothetical protein
MKKRRWRADNSVNDDTKCGGWFLVVVSGARVTLTLPVMTMLKEIQEDPEQAWRVCDHDQAGYFLLVDLSVKNHTKEKKTYVDALNYQQPDPSRTSSSFKSCEPITHRRPSLPPILRSHGHSRVHDKPTANTATKMTTITTAR